VSTAAPVLRRIDGPAAWTRVLRELARDLPPPAGGGGLRHRRVVIPMLVGASDLFAVREGLIGHALRMRGAEVTFVVCDGLAACDARTFDNDLPDQCHACRRRGWENLTAFGHRVVNATAFLDRATATRLWRTARDCPADRIFAFTYAGSDVGRHVYSSTLRYFRAGGPEWDRPEFVAQARRYLGAALLMAEAARAAICDLHADRVFTSHGVYASWGPWADVATSLGVEPLVYCGGYRRNTLMCAPQARGLFRPDGLWERVRSQPLTPEEERELEEYLASREDNRSDFHRYFDRVDRDLAALEERLGIAGRTWRRRLCLFANVAWDAAEPSSGGVFGSMQRWLVDTAADAARYPDCLLLVKAHPAESNFIEPTPERWRTARVLADHLGGLPDNIRVIPPEDNISTFALYRSLDAGIVNTSTVGFELALHGVPVLTSGAGAPYERDGLVLRPASRADYFATLQRLRDGTEPFRPDRDLVRRYAHAFFLRAPIPFEPLDVETWSPVGLAIETLHDLAPGRFPGLDALCDRILLGTEAEGAPA
jgi:hypothetical protein